MTVQIEKINVDELMDCIAESFIIRASSAAKIVGGSVGLSDSEKDFLLTCNEKREARKENIAELEKLYKEEKENGLVVPELVLPEPTKEFTTEKLREAHEKKIAIAKDRHIKKVATEETRHEKRVSVALERLNKAKDKPALTSNQDDKEKAILEKAANPDSLIPEGMISYCEMWVRELLYMRFKSFSTKETEKGNLVEDDSIAMICEVLSLGFAANNKESFRDEYMKGEPDIILAKLIIDAKNAYDFDNLPIFGDKLKGVYFWQGIVYCHLLGIKDYKVCYTLMNMPDEMIVKEAKKWSYRKKYEDWSMDDIIEKVRIRHSYDGLPLQLRYYDYSFQYSESSANHLIERVKLCRKYIRNVLLPQIKPETLLELLPYNKRMLKIIERANLKAEAEKLEETAIDNLFDQPG